MGDDVIDDRVRCLDTAKGYVTQDRTSAYGTPEDNFKNIADMWNAQGVSINGKAVTPADVALMMVGMKLARLKHNQAHEDSWIDVAGYAACGMRAANVQARLNEQLHAQYQTACGRHHDHEPHDFGEHFEDSCSGLAQPIDQDYTQEELKERGWVSVRQCGLERLHPAHMIGEVACDGFNA